MPRHLQVEHGFNADVSDLDDRSSRDRVIDVQIEATKEQLREVGTKVKQIESYRKGKEVSPTKDIESVTPLWFDCAAF